MPVAPTLPTRGILRSRRFGIVDVIVAAGAFALLYRVVHVGRGLNASTLSPHVSSGVSTSASNLPYYAARSLLRMFIALFASVLFTFSYGTLAARSRRAGAVLIPLLDILQSVPILGFLTITVSFFVALFPGSILGLECASIFAIFTSQVWNMTFSFYHSLISQPQELDEAARMMRLTMMSFGGGWFFLAASEAISISNHHYALGDPRHPSQLPADLRAGRGSFQDPVGGTGRDRSGGVRSRPPSGSILHASTGGEGSGRCKFRGRVGSDADRRGRFGGQ